MEQSSDNSSVRVPHVFESKAVAVIERDGSFLINARQAGAALGQGNGKRFVDAITREWGLEEGRHFVRVRKGTDSVPLARGSDPVFLTELGLYRALMRSRAPKAEAFQEWIAGEVLPAIRRTGRYDGGKPPAAPPGPSRNGPLGRQAVTLFDPMLRDYRQAILAAMEGLTPRELHHWVLAGREMGLALPDELVRSMRIGRIGAEIVRNAEGVAPEQLDQLEAVLGIP